MLEGTDVNAVAKFALEGGPVYPVYVVWFIATVIESLVKLRMGIASKFERHQSQLKLKYMFWAAVTGYGGGLPNFFYIFDIDVYPINPFSTYFVPIYALIMAYAVVKHQLLDVAVVVRKSLIYSVLVAIITAVYFSLILVAEKLLQGVVGYRSLIGSLIAGFVIALGFNPLKEFIQRFIDRLFFKGGQVALAEENEQLRQELARSEKLKAVATLAAGMAHEIKNPLSSIKTFAEYLPQKYDDPTFREKFARIVSQEVGKVNDLVQRLLDFAKPSPPRKEPVRLSTLIDETVEFLHGSLLSKQVEVVRAYTRQDEVLVDPAQMKQVFLNVLLNSLEAMDHQGCISISTISENGHLEIAMADTGPGIVKKDLPHVFDPFYTTKVSGTGLGLSVVHSIVKEHGGRVSVDSEPGRGTTVRIQLPINGGHG